MPEGLFDWNVNPYESEDSVREQTREMQSALEARHDWDEGQTWGSGGTRLSRTDSCRVCGMYRSWCDDSQNGVSDRYSYETHHGENLTLREALSYSCAD
jgi:hypothetical protein